MSEFITINNLWEKFDSRSEDLDVDVVRVDVVDGITVKQLYFTARTHSDGTKTRVYAVMCHKGDKVTKNGVLLIDNYKKPIRIDDLKFFAENGFTAMAIDYAGRRDLGKYTLYSPNEEYCNAEKAKSMFYVDDGAKNTKIYNYAANSMRAISYLQDEGVQNVSVVTVGKGAYIGAIVLAEDGRVTNGAVVFGTLYQEYVGEKASANADLAHNEDLSAHLKQEDKRQLWLMTLAPQSYAIQIKVPVYIITSANSELGNVEDVSKMFYRVNDESRLLVLPNTIEHLNEFYAKSVINWCKGKKVEEEIEIFAHNDNGNYYVTTNSTASAKKLSVWYCVEANSRTKHWMRAKLTRSAGEYRAKLNLYEPDCEVLVFALLDSDVAISSALSKIKVQNATNIILPSNIIFNGESEQELIPFDPEGRWRGADVSYERVAGYLNIVGAEGRAFATYAISDKSIRKSLTFTISFDVCCAVKQPLTVSVVHGFGEDRQVFSQEIQLVGDGKWQRVIVDEKNFKRVTDGKALTSEESIKMLMISAAEKIIVNNIIIV